MRAPAKLCRCGQVQPCPTHTRRQSRDTKTEDERQFYGSPQWKHLRAAHRAEEPLCRECGKLGIDRLGDMVDHIVPIRQGGDPTDERNLQTFCDPCHQKKRQRERVSIMK